MASNGKSIQIYLYVLERTFSGHPDEWSKVVVAAPNERTAREIANQDSKAEGYVWTDGNLVSVKQVGVADGDIYGVILGTKE